MKPETQTRRYPSRRVKYNNAQHLVPDERWRLFRVIAVAKGKSLVQAVTEAIEEWIERAGQSQPKER